MAQIEWRFKCDDAANGAWNMAVDEAMLLAHAQKITPPTLRFYDFAPECLSLGRLQKQLPSAVSQNDSERDFDIVRRPTGGRAVWHEHEITYCAVVREELLPPDSRSVEGAYCYLSEGFLRGLRELGLPVEMAPNGVRTSGPNCFAASASCDFVARGKKLIGAAQCRVGGAILQHGSLLLSIDAEKWQNYAGGPMQSATSLQELGFCFSRETMIEALKHGFESAVGIRWSDADSAGQNFSAQELQMAQSLLNGKYQRKSWTFGAQLTPAEAEKLKFELLKSGLRAPEL
jgi:lipoate-protein ligase A